MIRTAILFATRSPFFRNGKTVTPLTKVGSQFLVERSLAALEQLGLREILVVTDVAELLAENETDRLRHKLHLTANVRWVAKRHAKDHPAIASGAPVLVVGSEVIFNPDMVAPLLDRRSSDPAVALIDRRLARSYDVDRSVKARTLGSQLLEVGASVESYDALAVGVAALPAALLQTVRHAGHWIEVLQQLAERRQLQVREVAGVKWHQVVTQDTVRHADWLIRAYGADLRGDQPPQDGAVAQRILAYIEGLLSQSDQRPGRKVLMNPGPVMTSPRVKGALVHHDVCHRDEDYARVASRVRRRLKQVCGGPSHEVMLLAGSGTASMEAAISSFVPADRRLLVVSNGAFGERCAEIAEVHGIDTVHLRYGWGELVEPQRVARTLDADDRIFAVMMVHHETSVGLLNPIREVGAICRQRDRLFFVDGVASLGGEELDVEHDCIDVLVSSANKCLHAISGVSFVCAGPRVWPRVADIPPRVYYLDLKRYRGEQTLPYTPAVSTCFALDAAVDELLRDGVEHRIRHYRALISRIREALAALGVRRFTETGHESSSITIFEVPSYVSYDQLYEALKSRGYVIYGCKAHLKDRYFQIANMGELSDEVVEGFLDAFGVVLREYRELARPQLVAVAP